MTDKRKGQRDGFRDAQGGNPRRPLDKYSLDYCDGYEAGYLKGLEAAVRNDTRPLSDLLGVDEYALDLNDIELQALENTMGIWYDRAARERRREGRIYRQHIQTRKMIESDRQHDRMAGSNWPHRQYGLED